MDGILFLGLTIFSLIIFAFILKKRQNKKIKKFLADINKDTWIVNRVYIQEKGGNSNFFINPIGNNKVFYDTLRCFDKEHRPPAHIETFLSMRTGEIKIYKKAYVSLKKFKQIVFQETEIS